MNSVIRHDLPNGWEELVKASRQTRMNAYAEYSNYQVGAALRASDGSIFAGCNVENASYGLTICAERVAVCSAVSAGQKDFDVLCLTAGGIVAPCGACRQFLWEFGQDLLIVLDDVDRDSGKQPVCVALRDLLPDAFNLKR